MTAREIPDEAPPSHVPFDLRDALSALFRHIRPALLILSTAILGAGIYLLLTPAEYTADAKLIIRLGREKAAGQVNGGPNQNYMFSERAQNVNNEVEILRDPSIVRREFAALKAITPTGDLGPPPADWSEWLLYQGRRALREAKAAKTWIVDTVRLPFEAVGLLRHLTPDEKLTEAYLAAFKIVFVKETDVILTGFTWTDPTFAAEALNRLHSDRAHPVGQSLRGGTQTRQNLMENDDPAIRAFPQAIDGPIRAYLAELGEGDDLLRSRKTGDFRFAGLWSPRP